MNGGAADRDGATVTVSMDGFYLEMHLERAAELVTKGVLLRKNDVLTCDKKD